MSERPDEFKSEEKEHRLYLELQQAGLINMIGPWEISIKYEGPGRDAVEEVCAETNTPFVGAPDLGHYGREVMRPSHSTRRAQSMNTTDLDLINADTRDQWLNDIVRRPSSSNEKVERLMLHCLEMDKQMAELKSQLEKEALINDLLTAKLESLNASSAA